MFELICCNLSSVTPVIFEDAVCNSIQPLVAPNCELLNVARPKSFCVIPNASPLVPAEFINSLLCAIFALVLMSALTIVSALICTLRSTFLLKIVPVLGDSILVAVNSISAFGFQTPFAHSSIGPSITNPCGPPVTNIVSFDCIVPD